MGDAGQAGCRGERTVAEVSANFKEILDQLDIYPPKALIIRSGKVAGFIAGADIQEFTQLDTADKGRALVERGWTLFNRLAAVNYPTLAIIRGHCLGGGLELALACRYLLAVDEPGTKMGLPEVMLGIFPGWGGMLRLPQRVGPAALDMMLTGKTIDAKRAKRMGLADEAVPPRVMEQAARQLVLSGKRGASCRCCSGCSMARSRQWSPMARASRWPQGASGTLPGAVRDHRYLGEAQRQCAGGPGVDRRHHQFVHGP
jgi:3-hydroxyacyl-CoA dehydrogenase/enoyl-CoA hydratase/3-hydroxybutyryl-CoA epimerase